MKTILAPIDFSVVTPRVIETAIKLSRSLKGRIVILHIVPPPSTLRNVMPGIEDAKMRTTSAERAAEKKLLELKRRYRRRSPALQIAHVTGAPAARIVEAAHAARAAYIVLGSHGRSAMRDALIGSVAATVVRTAPCPVLVVPPFQARTPAPRA